MWFTPEGRYLPALLHRRTQATIEKQHSRFVNTGHGRCARKARFRPLVHHSITARTRAVVRGTFLTWHFTAGVTPGDERKAPRGRTGRPRRISAGPSPSKSPRRWSRQRAQTETNRTAAKGGKTAPRQRAGRPAPGGSRRPEPVGAKRGEIPRSRTNDAPRRPRPQPPKISGCTARRHLLVTLGHRHGHHRASDMPPGRRSRPSPRPPRPFRGQGTGKSGPAAGGPGTTGHAGGLWGNHARTPAVTGSARYQSTEAAAINGYGRAHCCKRPPMFLFPTESHRFTDPLAYIAADIVSSGFRGRYRPSSGAGSTPGDGHSRAPGSMVPASPTRGNDRPSRRAFSGASRKNRACLEPRGGPWSDGEDRVGRAGGGEAPPGTEHGQTT